MLGSTGQQAEDEANKRHDKYSKHSHPIRLFSWWRSRRRGRQYQWLLLETSTMYIWLSDLIEAIHIFPQADIILSLTINLVFSLGNIIEALLFLG
jgi:hypothetical protein